MASSKTLTQDTDLEFKIVCRPCHNEERASNVSYFCDQCQECLCDACRQTHEQIQLTKDHHISKAKVHEILKSKRKRIIIPFEGCSCGRKRKVALYCEDDVEIICSSCKHQKHRNCKTHYISILGKSRGSDEPKKEKTEMTTAKKPKKQKKRKEETRGLPKDRESKRSTVSGIHKRAENYRKKEVVQCQKLKPNSTLKDHSTVLDDSPSRDTNISVVAKEVGSVTIRRGDFTGNWVSSICLMPNGCPVLTEFSNDTLKVLDSETFEIKGWTKLAGPITDVAVVDENTVITTLCYDWSLQYVKLFPEVVSGRTIKLGNELYGVDVYAGEIFVLVKPHFSPSDEILVLDLDGNLRRSIAIREPLHDLVWPRHLVVSQVSGTIFISDHYSSTLLHLNREGDLIFKYNDTELIRLYGFCLDKDNNIFACGMESKTVQLISGTGQKITTLVTAAEDLKQPCSVAFRETDGMLMIGGRHTDQLRLFKING